MNDIVTKRPDVIFNTINGATGFLSAPFDIGVFIAGQCAINPLAGFVKPLPILLTINAHLLSTIRGAVLGVLCVFVFRVG
ncbi:hypothetical protein V5T82_16790 [Magnetovibrio sp. PR-2]|uniref:hypothetical protein n=1 Tax=Magnetovibrio sp. PR-2 TaxID=3120356 RepID=UPI002FCE2CA0